MTYPASERLAKELAAASQREVYLKDEVAKAKFEMGQMAKERDAALAEVQATEEKMAQLQATHDLEIKQMMDTCRVLRAENDRLREVKQQTSVVAHKTEFHLHRELAAEKKALMEAQHRTGERLGNAAENLAQSQREISQAHLERDQVVAAYYTTSEDLLEAQTDLEMLADENDELREGYEIMEQTFIEHTQAAQNRAHALGQEKSAFQAQMMKARAEMEDEFALKLGFEKSNASSERSSKVEMAALLQVTSDKVGTTRMQLEQMRAKADQLEKESAEWRQKVEHEIHCKEAEIANRKVTEEDLQTMKMRLHESQSQCDQLKLEREDTEIMLRSRVDWQKYAAPVFLAQGEQSRKHLQSLSPYKNVSEANAPDEENPAVPITVLEADKRIGSVHIS